MYVGHLGSDLGLLIFDDMLDPEPHKGVVAGRNRPIYADTAMTSCFQVKCVHIAYPLQYNVSRGSLKSEVRRNTTHPGVEIKWIC